MGYYRRVPKARANHWVKDSSDNLIAAPLWPSLLVLPVGLNVTAMDALAGYVVDRGYPMRLAIELKPNEPQEDILLPSIGHAPALHQRA